MRYKQLLEGVKFGQREHDAILKDHHSSFYIGIEYEFILPDNLRTNDIIQDGIDYVYNNQIRNIDKVEKEHDNMVEVITNVMPLLMGLKHIKNFFEVAKKNNVTFPSMSGLHVSISRKGAFDDDINLVKFMVLLDANYIHGIFPTRKYVQNASIIMRDAVQEFVSDNLGNDAKGIEVRDIEASILQKLNDENTDYSKYITAKISDYVSQGGRIELRFAGGKDYDKQFTSIVNQIVRACFLIGIAYDDQLYRKEYLKKLFTYIPNKDEMAVYNFFSNGGLFHKLTDKQKDMAFEKAKESSNNAYRYINMIGKPVPELEPTLFMNPSNAIHYALEFNVDNAEIRKIILDTVRESLSQLTVIYVHQFILGVMKERWPEYEEVLANSSNVNLIKKYIDNVLKKLHPDGIKVPAIEKALLDINDEDAINAYVEYAYDRIEWERKINP